MKKKILIIIILVLTCTSCSWNWGWNWDVDDEIKTNQEQKIQGPADCITNEWSWNNGVAEVGDTPYATRLKYFSFNTSISGKFTFAYSTTNANGTLKVEFNNNTAFEESHHESGLHNVDLGNLKSGTTVKFSGKYCYVKDLIITNK